MCSYREAFKRCQRCHHVRRIYREQWRCDAVHRAGRKLGSCRDGFVPVDGDWVQTFWEDKCLRCRFGIGKLLSRLAEEDG